MASERPIRRIAKPAALGAAALIATGLAAVFFLVVRDGPTALRPIVTDEPGAIPAMFVRTSYSPGQRGVLRITTAHPQLTVRLYRVGGERLRPKRDDVLAGVPVSPPRRIGAAGAMSTVSIPIEDWPSGFYYARLSARGRLGYTPFIVKPRRLGTSRVLVVLPTYTWQAYNFRDVDGDGVGDTWYADSSIHWVDLNRPYLNKGVPPHFRGYDRAFLRWLVRERKTPDVIADEDLEAVASGDELERLYDLIIFPGHEEYVTQHVFDVVQRYRDVGGNLAFLAANTFYYAVERHGHRLHGRVPWVRRGRSVAALTGSDYVGWFENRYPNRPYVVTGAALAPWLFARTDIHNGDSFGLYGIEVDARSAKSPAGTIVLARIEDVFGKGRSAEMTYYGTRRGAKVFSAGVMNFGGSLEYEPQSTMMENIWNRLTRP
jgi:hypothetical protein